MAVPISENICPDCGGTGWKIVVRGGLSGATRCKCRVESRQKSLREDAGIPPNFARATIESFLVPQDNITAKKGLADAMREVRSFVKEFPPQDRPGLLLVGDTGTGKTHLAVGALKALIEKGHAGLFFDYQTLLDRIRASYGGEGDPHAYASAMDAEVLLLDDLGSHRATEWVEDTVTAIITHRCNHRKPLIATTNLPDPDITGRVVESSGPGGSPIYKKTLAEVIGERARSRLFEMCRTVRMPSVEDYRVKRGR
jgi:DNA replication protein DnaC